METEQKASVIPQHVRTQGPSTPRLPLLPPSTLSPEQMDLYENILNVVISRFHGFHTQRDDGALIGPFNAMLHFPMFGAPAWAFNRARIEHSELPKRVHQLVILVTGARLGARYELYAHEILAEAACLSPVKIPTIVAGERPADLSREEPVAYDLAAALNGGAPLSGGIFKAARELFGERGLAEIVFLVGCFCMVSVLLNTYDLTVPVISSESGLPG
jgi:4-carboxymuconolactone decarboxylase